VEAESDQHSRLIIRPEHIDLLGENGKISGKITELIYKGSVTTVGVMTNIGDREKIIQAEVHAEAAMQLDEGDTVHLDWSETNAMVVPVR
jgi:ABC-type Fe3+/spermidine/putrescine transport system ATPase subunit